MGTAPSGTPTEDTPSGEPVAPSDDGNDEGGSGRNPAPGPGGSAPRGAGTATKLPEAGAASGARWRPPGPRGAGSGPDGSVSTEPRPPLARWRGSVPPEGPGGEEDVETVIASPEQTYLDRHVRGCVHCVPETASSVTRSTRTAQHLAPITSVHGGKASDPLGKLW